MNTDKIKTMEELLIITYAEELRVLLKNIVEKKCFGCQYARPSQREHDVCIMTEFEDQVDLYFFDALKELDHLKIVGKWFARLKVHLQQCIDKEVAAFLKSKEGVWKQLAWREKVKERLLTLEHFPYA